MMKHRAKLRAPRKRTHPAKLNILHGGVTSPTPFAPRTRSAQRRHSSAQQKQNGVYHPVSSDIAPRTHKLVRAARAATAYRTGAPSKRFRMNSFLTQSTTAPAVSFENAGRCKRCSGRRPRKWSTARHVMHTAVKTRSGKTRRTNNTTLNLRRALAGLSKSAYVITRSRHLACAAVRSVGACHSPRLTASTKRTKRRWDGDDDSGPNSTRSQNAAGMHRMSRVAKKSATSERACGCSITRSRSWFAA
mmetsp:Transcript_34247/g.105815  ORF Transcript_34247/g.105815 Transcript_34247/m.105815 type:complete len:247 (-) Transcript_34247:291-1031(-)